MQNHALLFFLFSFSFFTNKNGIDGALALVQGSRVFRAHRAHSALFLCDVLKDAPLGKNGKESEELYWIENYEFPTTRNGSPSDPANETRAPEKSSPALSFCVGGKPVPLVRHRTTGHRGKFPKTYNPSAPKQAAFRRAVAHVLPEGFAPLPDFLEMRLIFRMRRPRAHFVNRRAGPDRLRPDAPPLVYDGASDVDNLAKFVMDALNEVLYEDDRQIVSLSASKVYDNVGDCFGATEVYLRPVEDGDMHELLGRSIR